MRTLALMMVASAALSVSTFAADAPEPTQAQIDEIIQKFAAKEAEFAKARESYTYHQTARIQELGASGNVEGRWETISDIIFDPGPQTRGESRARPCFHAEEHSPDPGRFGRLEKRPAVRLNHHPSCRNT